MKPRQTPLSLLFSLLETLCELQQRTSASIAYFCGNCASPTHPPILIPSPFWTTNQGFPHRESAPSLPPEEVYKQGPQRPHKTRQERDPNQVKALAPPPPATSHTFPMYTYSQHKSLPSLAKIFPVLSLYSRHLKSPPLPSGWLFNGENYVDSNGQYFLPTSRARRTAPDLRPARAMPFATKL